MTRIVVEPGICGFNATVEATGLSRGKIKVTIATNCEMGGILPCKRRGLYYDGRTPRNKP